MHSLLARANALFAFSLWVMAAVTAACFLSTVFLDYTTDSQITVKDIKLRQIVDYATDERKVDHATMAFGINVDFRKVFNWNVKQLFVYLVAEYASKENAVNQVVIYDKILKREEGKLEINESNLRTKYYFLDDGSSLINHKNVTFVLRYNVVPNAGYLRLSQAEGQIVVPFPVEYTVKRR